jgi:hypothetical protein
MEDWQSEFLQLFSFAVLPALFIHKAAPSPRTTTSRCRIIQTTECLGRAWPSQRGI